LIHVDQTKKVDGQKRIVVSEKLIKLRKKNTNVNEKKGCQTFVGEPTRNNNWGYIGQ